jgi:hypothetical protein
MDMYRRARESDLSDFALADAARTILLEDLPLVDCSPAVTEEVVGFRFFSGTVIWLDVVSSITVGKAPYLMSFRTNTLSTLARRPNLKLSWAVRVQ